jgi:adenylate kinase
MSHSSAHDHASWLQVPSAQCELPKALDQPWRLILLGAPGVGKGTQADLLTRELHACHLSTGDVFRAAAKSEWELSPAMKIATEHMRRGELVPDATVWAMVCERVGCLRCPGGFILDGFPRTLAQVESLTALLHTERLVLDAVVSYELPADEIVARLSGRRTCKQCRTAFHVIDRPAKVEGVCDRCGGELFQRDDDRAQSIQVRLERSTAPLIEFYAKAGILLQVSATGLPEDICTRTLAGLRQLRTLTLAR